MWNTINGDVLEKKIVCFKFIGDGVHLFLYGGCVYKSDTSGYL